MLRRSILILPLLAVSACFAVHIPPEDTAPEVKRLLESTSQTVALVVNNPTAESSHGHQFMLGIIPVTRIFPDGLTEIVTTALQVQAGLAGVGLVKETASNSAQTYLDVTIQDVDIDGYDLIVLRRPSAHVTLRGTVKSPLGSIRVCEKDGHYSELSRFAFTAELRQALENAAKNAAAGLLECLGVTTTTSASAAPNSQALSSHLREDL